MTDPVNLLVAAVSAEAGAIAFLVLWIRGLYAERRMDQERELSYRDEMLERVLTACGKLADAVAIISEQRQP